MRFNLYEQVQPSSIDLRLDNKVIRFKRTVESFDIRNLDRVKDHIEEFSVQKGEPITLEPNELIFGQTYEQLKMPSFCMGILEGKSRFARLGLAVHSTGGYINPDFQGVMPLQIINHNKIPITIYPFISLCQLILFRTDSVPLIPYPERTNNPYYKEQIASPSVIHRDKNISDASDNVDHIQLERERRKIDSFIRNLESYSSGPFSEGSYGFAEPHKRESTPSPIINFNGGNNSIATLNLGSIIGNVNSTLESLNQNGHIKLTQSITGIAKAIAASGELEDEKKYELLEYLQLLTSEAKKPMEQRNNAVVKTVLSALEKALEVGANLADIWAAFGPPVLAYFLQQ